MRRTIELLNAQHRFAEADQVLRRLEQQPLALSNDVERLASEASARVEDLGRAAEIATKVAKSSRDWHDYIWLGELQILLGAAHRRPTPRRRSSTSTSRKGCSSRCASRNRTWGKRGWR